MANRKYRPITDKEAKNATKTLAVGDVPGLTLRVGEKAKSLVLRTKIDGRERWITIGEYPIVTLSAGRKKAREILADIASGEFQQREQEEKEKAQAHTVESLLRAFIASETERGRWCTTGRQTHADKADGWIRNHMSADFKALPIEELTTDAIAKEFGEAWRTMRSTPEKCIGEIKRAWDWAIARGITDRTNPASATLLKYHLATASKRPKRTHQPHLPPERIPEFFAQLGRHTGVAVRALSFAILTCARVSNALETRWEQLNIDSCTQTIPREEMKIKGLTFDRVTPLSRQAVGIIKDCPRRIDECASDYIFKDSEFTRGRHLSETSLRNLIRRMSKEIVDAGGERLEDPHEVGTDGQKRVPTPHGLARTSFTTWANSPGRYGHRPFDADIVEACLDHFSPKYGGAYMREYPIEDMREIMQAWADYCYSKTEKAEH